MTPRAAMLWWAAALALLAAAVATTLARPSAVQAPPDSEPAFAALRAAPEAVAEIALADGAQTLTLVALADGSWAMAERGDYAADPEAVREIVAALADNLRKYEEQFGEVDDPGDTPRPEDIGFVH